MSAEVVEFKPTLVGDGAKFDADTLLEGQIGKGLSQVVIIAVEPNGEVIIAGTDGAAETLWLIERGKHELLKLHDDD